MSALKYLSCILLLIFSSKIYTQIPDTVWTKTFGGPLSDVGNSVKQTNDGSFIIAGTTSSFGAGGQDIYLIKTDENGDTLWTKTFGGVGNDRASNVVQTNDNGYAIFGTTNSFGNGGDDFLLWKTDSLGHTEWYKTYGGTNSEIASEGKQTMDGGYIITGYFYSQYYRALVIKVDELGKETWNKILIRSLYTHLWARSVDQATDKGYVVGCTWSFYYSGNYAYMWYICKLSENGDSLYSKEVMNVQYDHLKVVRNTIDGNLILGGSSGYGIIMLLKMNPLGGNLWARLISAQTYVWLSSLEPTRDNGFILTATSESSAIILLKIDESGILQWEKRIYVNDTNANSVYPTNDEGYIVTGYTKSSGAGDSDIWLLKFKYNSSPEITVVSPNGGEFWLVGSSQNILWTSNEVDSVKIELSLDNGVGWYTIADSTPSDGEFEWIAEPPQTSSECKMRISDIKDSTIFDESDSTFVIDILPSVDDSLSSILPDEFALFQNYPNPFNPVTRIKFDIPAVTLRQAQSDSWVTLKVYDVLGNEVVILVNEEKPAGTYEVEFNTSSIKPAYRTGRHLPSSGIYFYQLRAGAFVETKKMVLIK